MKKEIIRTLTADFESYANRTENEDTPMQASRNYSD